MQYRGTAVLVVVVALVAGIGGALFTRFFTDLDGPSVGVSESWVHEGAGQAALGSQGSFADAVSRSAPAVVSIFATRVITEPSEPPEQRQAYPYGPYGAPPPLRGETRETGLGSGVILSADGLILTNRHVVQGAERIRVILADGHKVEVAVLGVDAETDLAVLKADAVALPTAPIGDPRSLRVGDLVLAIGNPYGMGQTVTQGIVSATRRAGLGITRIEDYIQTDAAINPGNSGGALINSRGDLIGINTAIYSESGASGGIGFAIPSDLALKVARSIADQGQVVRGWIGMSGRSVTPELVDAFGLRAPHGVLVSSTLDDSPAQLAGLRPGDVVTRVGNREVDTVQELLDAVAGTGPNRPVSLEVWRGSQRLETNAVTGERPHLPD
jgi:serine protease DegS